MSSKSHDYHYVVYLWGRVRGRLGSGFNPVILAFLDILILNKILQTEEMKCSADQWNIFSYMNSDPIFPYLVTIL